MEAESAVPCLVRFRKQNRAWKNNNYTDFLFKNVFKFYYKNILFLSIKLISFDQKHQYRNLNAIHI